MAHGDPAMVVAGFHADTLTVATSEQIELVDLTDRVRAVVAACGVRVGLVNVCSLHTTAAVLVTRSDGTLLAALRRALEGDPVPGVDWLRHTSGC